MKTRHLVALIILCATLLSSDQALAQFSQQGPKLVGSGAVGNALQGLSVSLSGDGNTAIAAGPLDNSKNGAAWVWTRSGGVWTQQATKLVTSNTVGISFDGGSVALSADGNTAIVGRPGDSNGNAGAAWLWTRSGGVWTQQATKLIGSGAKGPASQGDSVSLSSDGNTAIVGGSGDNSGAGAAWVWTRSGGVWTQQGTKLVGSGGVGIAYQGYSVCLSADGNTAIVGGPGDSGAAWIWTRSGGVWTQQGPKLVGSGAVGNASQGVSVSLSADGSTAIVGGENDNGSVGAAWVWTRSGGVWTQQGSKLVGSGTIVTSRQGRSISLSADGRTAIVGGPGDNSGAGAAWIWTRSGGVWTQPGPKLVGSGAVGNASQGFSVSLSGDGNTAIVGGPGDNNGAGAAWLFVDQAVGKVVRRRAVAPGQPTIISLAGTAVTADDAGKAVFNLGGITLPVQLIDELTGTPVAGLSAGFALDPGTPTHGVLMVIDPLQRYPPQIVALRGVSQAPPSVHSFLSQSGVAAPVAISMKKVETKTIEVIETIALGVISHYVPKAPEILDLAVVGAKAFNRVGVPTGPLTGLDSVRTETLTQAEAWASIRQDVLNDSKQKLFFLTGELLLTGGASAPVTLPGVVMSALTLADSSNTVLNCGRPGQTIRVTTVGPDILGMKFYECQHLDTAVPLYRVPAEGFDERGLPLSTGSLELVSKTQIGLGIKTPLDSGGKATPEVPVGDYEVRLTSPGFAPATKAVQVPQGGTSLSINLERPPTASPFDGSYTGSFSEPNSNSCGGNTGGTVPWAFSISNSQIIITFPGVSKTSTTTISISDSGSAMFVFSDQCGGKTTFVGTFVVTSSGAVTASGSWSNPGVLCDCGGAGTWTGSKP